MLVDHVDLGGAVSPGGLGGLDVAQQLAVTGGARWRQAARHHGRAASFDNQRLR